MKSKGKGKKFVLSLCTLVFQGQVILRESIWSCGVNIRSVCRQRRRVKSELASRRPCPCESLTS